jgi:alpha-1,3-rhamnosyl/mannosyltransferase
MRLLRVPAGRLVVTELAPSEPAPQASADRSREVLAALGLEDAGYVLTIGTLEPRKNIHRLIAAFERIADRGLRLVLLGGRGWHTSVIDRALATSTARSRIVVPGYVSDEARSILLRHARAFAYVSVYEGYGLPVVEAMAEGIPVVASNLSSLPEASGGAAVLVDPHDVLAIARGIDETISRREELADAGRARASLLSWDRTAAATIQAYEAAQRLSV